MKKAIAIIGPTASGKSDIAIQLAKRFNGEVISCDSRQIYRGMDIGTGKVSGTWNLKRGAFISEGVTHWMIDIVNPMTDYNVAKYQKKARKILRDILHRGKLPILCGGTGFWAQALVEDISFPKILPDKKLRQKLDKESTDQLVALLRKKDPGRVKTIDTKNRVRLIRALEIAQSKKKTRDMRYEIRDVIEWKVYALNTPREKLFRNIEKRLNDRLGSGMLDEIWQLHYEKKVPWSRMEVFGLEYRWVSRYLRGHIVFEKMREKLLINIRHYAKRQLTWIRRWEKMGRKIYWLPSSKRIMKP